MSARVGAIGFSRLVQQAGLAQGWAGAVDPPITSIIEDSRQVTGGACFVAVRGTRTDGHAYVSAAVQAGAVAVVCEQPVSVPANVAVLQLASARGAAGRLACAFHGLDQALADKRLRIVGITGTNGKSTFCYLLRSTLQSAGCPTALLGTVQYDLLVRKIEASMTTPPAVELVGYLAEAARAGATHAVMEVSSHALDQGRCEGLSFAVGVFSNLTGDHLDYHGDMESYLRAKKRMFDGLAADSVAVINGDDPAGERMVQDCPAAVIRYRIDGGRGEPAPWRRMACEVVARILEQSAAGTRLELIVRRSEGGLGAECPSLALRARNAGRARNSLACASGPEGAEQRCELFTPLIGNHNVQNCLAAVSAGLGLGLSLDSIVHGLAAVESVPGRLQRVVVPQEHGFAVFVDYAHTDDALNNVLSALKPFTAGAKLIAMFGCGGDRDRTKRPRMAAAVARWADRIILTSDNPRTEDPLRIIDDAMAGFDYADLPRVQVEPDRRKAITAAIEMAGEGDIVLLAGKGHETYQQIGTEKFPFDDAAVAAECLRNLAGQTQEKGKRSITA